MGHQQILEARGLQKIPKNSKKFQRIPKNSKEFQKIPKNFYMIS
jgi:hypothetical protein